ncbi:MAG: hypothetical protein IKO55_04205 [Kiritimatiellae bacterium]|nr:hypothetical protein [Kiritimatiellia bacterium]
MANLTQLKMLEELDGFLLVDKPAGIAFSSVVKAVKRKFNLVKVGHGGSLDSAASGLFILLINDANKFVGDVMGADRAYEGVMRLGLKTNTHDIQGETLSICELGPVMPELPGKIAAALPEFKGDIFQTESRWCSVRREGSATYEIADTGDHKPFMTHVYKLSLGEIEGEKLPFSVSGTKGLIVRTLVNDFGEAIGCGAALESLRRVKIGKFSVDAAIPFDKLLDTDIKDFASCVMPLGEALR